MQQLGKIATIAELAAREGIARSSMTCVLRVTLAQDIVNAILDGNQVPEVALVWVLERFPTEREDQSKNFKIGARRS